jgi:8-oxo-dGTP pyrophosphatase MutT (NUDIX family)
MPMRGDTIMKRCDGTTVTVLIGDGTGKYLFFDRATPPWGTAMPAGHIDRHGSPEDAARAEVFEETGYTVTSLTWLNAGWRDNACRRRPFCLDGRHGHFWHVYRGTVTGEPDPSPRETRNMRWLTKRDIQVLAARTAWYARARISPAEFRAEPGIEPAQVEWLIVAGLVTMHADDLDPITHLAAERSC